MINGSTTPQKASADESAGGVDRNTTKRVKAAAPSPGVKELIESNSPLIEKFYTTKDMFPIAEGWLKAADGQEWTIVYDLVNAQSSGKGLVIPYSAFLAYKKRPSLRGKFLWLPQKDKSFGAPGILLSFDDHYQKYWIKYFDLFEKYQATATFCIIGYDAVAPFNTEALKDGFDIGYHTFTHEDLRRIPKNAFYKESISSTAPFREASVPLTAFAYPAGAYAPWMNTVLLKHYRILRGYDKTFQLYAADQIDHHFIQSRAVDTIFFKEDKDFKKSITLMLRTAKFVGGILPLTTHIILPSRKLTFGISPARLEFLLKTASNLELNFYRYSDFTRRGD
jgi:peptidoglycan/xylan/chitin deacetylase (PgdA/CDA1 family)